MAAIKLAPSVQGADTAGVSNDIVLSIQGSNAGIPVISTISGTVDVSDRVGRLLGIIASITAAVDVSDRAARLVGIVDTELPSPAALADGVANPTLPSVGAALLAYNGASYERVRSNPGDAQTGTGHLPVNAMLWNGASWDRQRGDTTNGLRIQPSPSTLAVFISGGAAAIATLTLPAAGVGLFIYLDYLRISRVATAALVGAALVAVTTTGITGAPTYRTGNLMAAGDTKDLVNMAFSTPLKGSAANTAMTFVGANPGAAVSWDMQAHYHIGP